MDFLRNEEPMKTESLCLHAGYTPKNGEPRVLPIVQSTTFTYDSTAEVAKLFDLETSGFFYTRLGNPTVDAVEQKIAALEGGVGALCTSSGQAANLIAILNVAQYWERQGYRVTLLGVDNKGRLDLDEYAAALSDDTALVSIMYANNEVGNVFPISRMAEMAAEKLFHTDAVQAVGNVPINVVEQNIDLLSLSGHKLHAPKGIGVLYVRKGVRFRPFLRGGHQERGRRAGTENVPYIVGLGMAAQLAGQHMQEERTQVARLRDKLEQGLLAAIPDCMVNGDPENRLPNTTNIAFKNVEGEAILLMLDQLGICASSGSACTSGSLEPSHVLRAMGVPFTYAHGSVRLSLSRYTTEEEIDFVVENMPQVIKTLRAISPFKN
mgnify:CR=1 FL=1